MPGISATGRNTATIDMVVATTARPISSAASIDGLIGALAHAHVPDDIFDLDDRVVDQHTRDQAHRQQRQAVQVIPIKSMNQKAGIADSGMASAEMTVARKSRRNRKTTSTARMAPWIRPSIAREILLLGVVDLIEDLDEADPRILLLDLAQFLPGVVIGGDFGGALGPLDVEADHLPPVHLGDGALLRIGVLDLAEVGEADRAATADDDLGLRQLIGAVGIAEHADRLLGPGDLGAAPGGVEVGLAKLLVDLRGGDPLAPGARRGRG